MINSTWTYYCSRGFFVLASPITAQHPYACCIEEGKFIGEEAKCLLEEMACSWSYSILWIRKTRFKPHYTYMYVIWSFIQAVFTVLPSRSYVLDDCSPILNLSTLTAGYLLLLQNAGYAFGFTKIIYCRLRKFHTKNNVCEFFCYISFWRLCQSMILLFVISLFHMLKFYSWGQSQNYPNLQCSYTNEVKTKVIYTSIQTT